MASKYYVTHTVCFDGALSIGYSKVKHPARHGAKVYMGARNRSNVAGGRWSRVLATTRLCDWKWT